MTSASWPAGPRRSASRPPRTRPRSSPWSRTASCTPPWPTPPVRGARDLFEDSCAAGINVVSSGPVFLQYPYGVVPDDMLDSRSQGRGRRRRVAARERHRPRLRQRRAAAGADALSAAHRRGALPRDRRLLDVLPADGHDFDLMGFGKPDGRRAAASSRPASSRWRGARRAHHRRRARPRPRRAARRVRRVRRRAPDDFETVPGPSPKGTPPRRALRGASARSTASPVVVLEHVTRLRDDLAPDWPQPAGATAATASRSRASPSTPRLPAPRRPTATTTSPAAHHRHAAGQRRPGGRRGRPRAWSPPSTSPSSPAEGSSPADRAHPGEAGRGDPHVAAHRTSADRPRVAQ